MCNAKVQEENLRMGKECGQFLCKGECRMKMEWRGRIRVNDGQELEQGWCVLEWIRERE